jgi:nucleoside-diphosphate-sugar epimerase
VTVVHGDFGEASELLEIIKAYKVTDIFHLAYMLLEAERYISRAIRVNCLGTSELFEVACVAGIRRVVWASSGAVYGHLTVTFNEDAEPISENGRTTPDSMYGASKLLNERTAETLVKRGLDHIGLRFTSIYGLGRGQRRGIHPDIYSSLIEHSYNGQECQAPPASQHYPWTYVKDAANALYAAYRFREKPSERIFNVSGESRTIGEVADYLKAILPKANIKFGNKPVSRLAVGTMDRIEKVLGFSCEYTMEKGVQDYIQGMKMGNK